MINNSQKKWDLYYLNICEAVRLKSKDPSRKVGAIITSPENQVISTGFNGFPIGVQDSLNGITASRYEGTKKYDFTVHAEVNAIAFAARAGVSTNNGTLYCSLFPCKECSKALIQAGIRRIVTFVDRGKDNGYNFDVSHLMLEEAGIEIKLYNKEELYD
jgi:dCMP deaminase